MAEWITLDSVIKCDHKGVIQNVNQQDWVTIDVPVLVDNDPEGRDIDWCPNSGPTIKKCGKTLQVAVGYSTWIRIDGHAVVLATLSVSLFDLGSRGVKVLGELPQGLPGFSFPWVSGIDLVEVLLGGIAFDTRGDADKAAPAEATPASKLSSACLKIKKVTLVLASPSPPPVVV